MSQVRFYLDADSMNHALVAALRAESIDVETAQEVGLRTAGDDDHIPYVLRTGRVLVTGDNLLIHRLTERTRQGEHHPGILVLPSRHRHRIGDIASSLYLVKECYSVEEMVDRIEYIPY